MPSNELQPKTELPVIPVVVAEAAVQQTALSPVEKETEKKKKTSNLKFQKVLRSYLVPLAVLSIFGGMLMFLIIPKISEILAQLDSTNDLYAQARTMDEEIQRLNALTVMTTDFQANLDVINRIAPSGATEVVNFQKKILDLSRASNLIVQQSTLEESVKKAEDKTSISNLGIIEIPSTFSLRGHFLDLKAFVQQIRSLNDFVIIGEMSLRSNIDPNATVDPAASTDDWTLIITLIKYQFLVPNAQNQLAEVFKRVPPQATVNQSVIDFANNKFAGQQSVDSTTPTIDLSGGN